MKSCPFLSLYWLGLMMVFGSGSLPADEKQPLSDERVAGEILAGGIGNAIGLLVVRVVVTSHHWNADDETRFIARGLSLCDNVSIVEFEADIPSELKEESI